MGVERLFEQLKDNKDMLGILKDEKTLETFIAMKQVFADRFLERGDMRFLLLNSISAKPKNGYQIMMSISRKFGGMYKPSPGVVYPTLQSLEEEGLIKSEDVSGKKIYSMTKKGVDYFKKNKRRVEEIFSNFAECHFLQDEKVLKRFNRFNTLWVQIAHEIYFKSINNCKQGGSEVDKRLDKIERILESTLEESKAVWK